MAIDLQATMDEIREKLHEFRTDQRYRTANKSREARAKMIADTGMCSGKLQTCKNLLASRIEEQCRNIEKGRQEFIDTAPLIEIVRESAVSYLLLRDAKYYLNTVGDYDNITRAYCALDAASGKITGSRSFLGMKRRLPFQKKSYQEKITEETRQKKQEFVDAYLDNLLAMKGDIEAWLKLYSSQGRKNAPPAGGLRNTVASEAEDENLDEILRSMKDDIPEEDFDNLEAQGNFDLPAVNLPDENLDDFFQSSEEEPQEYHS